MYIACCWMLPMLPYLLMLPYLPMLANLVHARYSLTSQQGADY